MNVARALQEFGDVEVVVVDGEGRPELGPRADHTLKIAYSVPVHLRPSSNVWRKLQWAFDPRSHVPARLWSGRCGDAARAGERTAIRPDLVQQAPYPEHVSALGMAALGGGYRRRAEHVRALDSPE